MTDEAKIRNTRQFSLLTARTGVSVKGPLSGQGEVCELVLRALPEWFGMEIGVMKYIRKAGELPSFAHIGVASPWASPSSSVTSSTAPSCR